MPIDISGIVEDHHQEGILLIIQLKILFIVKKSQHPVFQYMKSNNRGLPCKKHNKCILALARILSNVHEGDVIAHRDTPANISGNRILLQ